MVKLTNNNSSGSNNNNNNNNNNINNSINNNNTTLINANTLTYATYATQLYCTLNSINTTTQLNY